MTNVVFALLHVGLVWRYQVNISLSFEIQNIDLVLVSTAFQRLDLSEFEFLFQVCEYFHVARYLNKHWTKIVKSQNKKTTEDDGTLSLSPLQLDLVAPSYNFVTKPLFAEPIQAPLRSTTWEFDPLPAIIWEMPPHCTGKMKPAKNWLQQ